MARVRLARVTVAARVHPRLRGPLAGVALVALTVVAYLPAFDAGFIWDDDQYVTASRVIHDGAGLLRTWTSPASIHQYYPLVRTSLWLEHQVWGANPRGYHVVNVILHGLNALLLWRLLRRLSLPAPWVVAAVFALHPVHVESVAWISERKNVLSGFFALLALNAAIRFLDNRRPSTAAGAFVAYMAALLSKTVTSTLPAVVGVLYWWRRPAWQGGSRGLAVLGMAALSVGAAFGWLTAHLESDVVGAGRTNLLHGPVERVLVAGRALWFYLGKLLWPTSLSFVYERWSIDQGSVVQYLWPLAFVALLVAAWTARQRWGRGPLAALLLFAGTLVPAIGFFDLYPHRFSWVADHFQYLASIPALTLFVAMGHRASARLAPSLRVAVPVVAVVALGTLTNLRTLVFESPEALWRDTLAKNPHTWLAHNNLGMDLGFAGQDREAMEHLGEAARLEPTSGTTHLALGLVHERFGRLPEAEAEMAEALRLGAASGKIRMRVGDFHVRQKRLHDALRLYEEAAQRSPSLSDPFTHAGAVHLRLGDRDRAREAYRRALQIDPMDRAARAGLEQLR